MRYAAWLVTALAACAAPRGATPGDGAAAIDAPPTHAGDGGVGAHDAPADARACTLAHSFDLQPGWIGQVDPDPYALAVIDANHDGYDDLVIADGTSVGGAAGLYLNNRDGTFGARLDLANVAGARALAAADLDGDGVRDDVMVMLAAPAAALAPRISHGDGTFGGSNVAMAAAAPDQLVMADLDGDGLDDALVLHRAAGAVYAYRHRPAPDDDWQVQPVIAVSPGARAIAAAKADGDATVDLIVSYGDQPYVAGQVAIYPGTAPFQFGPPVSLAALPMPLDVVAGKLRPGAGAGLSIAAVGAQGGNSGVDVWHFDGVAFAATPNLETGASPRALILADLDGDGTNDLVTADYESNSVNVIANLGDGTFAQHQAFYAQGWGAIDLAAGDFDHDGRVDIAVLNLITNNVVVMLNRCL